MEKRNAERIPVNLDVHYHCGSSMCHGTVTNLSENGMFINTKIEFPFDLNFELDMHLAGEHFKAPVTVKRIVRTDNYYGGIGVELSDPPLSYLELIEILSQGKEEK